MCMSVCVCVMCVHARVTHPHKNYCGDEHINVTFSDIFLPYFLMASRGVIIYELIIFSVDPLVPLYPELLFVFVI